jgi:hypothetical protein
MFFLGHFKYGEDCLPEHISQKKHDDFPWPLSLLDRKVNVICGILPPKKIMGNPDPREWKGAPKPVPLQGNWQLSILTIPTCWWSVRLPYLAFTTWNGWHFRFSPFRWDDVDDYHTLPGIAFKKIQHNWEWALWNRYQA